MGVAQFEDLHSNTVYSLGSFVWVITCFQHLHCWGLSCHVGYLIHNRFFHPVHIQEKGKKVQPLHVCIYSLLFKMLHISTALLHVHCLNLSQTTNLYIDSIREKWCKAFKFYALTHIILVWACSHLFFIVENHWHVQITVVCYSGLIVNILVFLCIH